MTQQQAERLVVTGRVLACVLALVLALVLSACEAIGTGLGIGGAAAPASGWVLTGESCGANPCPPNLNPPPGAIHIGPRFTLHLQVHRHASTHR